jgi:hypothetical protein
MMCGAIKNAETRRLALSNLLYLDSFILHSFSFCIHLTLRTAIQVIMDKSLRVSISYLL